MKAGQPNELNGDRRQSCASLLCVCVGEGDETRCLHGDQRGKDLKGEARGRRRHKHGDFLISNEGKKNF